MDKDGNIPGATDDDFQAKQDKEALEQMKKEGLIEKNDVSKN